MDLRARHSVEAKAFIGGLCFEHVEEALSLWDGRGLAVHAPHHTLADLRALDDRLDAHIDALTLEGDAGWAECESALGRGMGGHFFAATLLALNRGDQGKMDLILEKAVLSEDAVEGVIGALGWLPWERAEASIQRFFASKEALQIRMALAACAFHRQDPGYPLDAALTSDDAKLARTALYAAGGIRQRNGKHIRWSIEDQLKSGNDDIRFWASWSGTLLGYEDMTPVCKSFARAGFPLAQDALNLVIRKISRSEAILWINELSCSSATRRLAIVGSGLMGDTVNIPWLLGQMKNPVYARVAGEAFHFITGLDLREEAFEGKCPDGYNAGPNDDPDDPNVEMDPDENLPWPNEPAIRAWWGENRKNYPQETRLLLGKPITEPHLRHILQTGSQRERCAAALELVLLEPGTPLFNTAAPAWRQIEALNRTTKRAARAAHSATAPVKPIFPNYGKRELVITAANCVTPVGLTAAQTAASVRAGICRFRISNDYKDQNGNPVTVAKIQGIREGVIKTIERMGDIAVTCLKELIDGYMSGSRRWTSDIHFFLGVPSGERPGPDYSGKTHGILQAVIAKRVGKPVTEIIPHGNASFHYAIAEAARMIADKPDALCVIGCMDSCLDDATLDWLESNDRLMSSSHGRNHALIASEAVSFMIVEDRENAQKTHRPVLAKIRSLGLAEEPNPRASDEEGISKGLTDACHAALAPIKDQDIAAILTDLNGEAGRAEEWGVAQIRCFGKKQGPWHLLNPGMRNYGDIGAASGGVLACVAVKGFERNWLPSPVMIFCSDDYGPCGALVLEKEE